MICFIALFVFAVLGIFSASHRELAKEAFDCVFRRMTFRKCESAFDQKMKMRISTGLLKKSPAAGKFVYKHFELISWILTISMIVSFIFAAIGGYNFIMYGNCNGEDSTEFCVYDGLVNNGETNTGCGLETCGTNEECDYTEESDCTTDCGCGSSECNANQLEENFINKSLQNYVYNL